MDPETVAVAAPNLSDFDTASRASGGAVMKVEHPTTGVPIEGWTITLLGADAPECVRLRKQQATARLNRGSAQGRVKLDADELEDEGLALLVVATKAWTLQDGGRPLECVPSVVGETYRKHRWLREQAARFIADMANFLGN